MTNQPDIRNARLSTNAALFDVPRCSFRHLRTDDDGGIAGDVFDRHFAASDSGAFARKNTDAAAFSGTTPGELFAPVTPQAWLPEFTVNANTDFQQSNPNVVQLENGEFWVSWTDTNPDGVGSPTGSDIVGQHFDVLGNRIGGEIRLNTAFSADDEANAAMASDVGSNDFFLVFDDGLNILLEHRTSSGGAAGSLTIASSSPGVFPTNSDIAVATASNGLVVYQRNTYNFFTETFDNDIVGQFFNPATNMLIGGNFDILNESDKSGNPDIAVREGGALGTTYLIVVQDEFGGTDRDIVYFSLLPNGTSSGKINVAATTAEETDASITALTGDGFVISWTSSVNNGDILFARYNSDGVKQGATTTVAAGSNVQGKSEVAATDDGGFTVTWQDTTLNRIFMRSFTSNGTPGGTGASAEVDIGLADADIATLGLGDGRTLVSYGQGDNVRASIFDPRSAVNAPAYTTDTQVGRAGDDVFNVSFGAERVFGYNGNDTITEVFSAAGLISGGNGNDTIISYLSNFSRTFRGDAGNDTLVLSSGGMPTISFDMFFGTLSSNGISSTASQFENFTYTGAGSVSVSGTSGGNSITGGSGNDSLEGFGGGDTLDGGDGSDTIDGGSGDDRLNGGAGQDSLVGGDDDDRIFGGADGDTLTGNGGNDSLYGNAGLDSLDGGGGNDKLVDKQGYDTLVGGSGDDLFITPDGTSTIIEATNGGFDTVRTSVDYVLADNVEALLLRNADGLVGTGNSLNNTISSIGGDDSLSGLGGNDVLFGAGGDDTLDGGSGSDELYGGNGSDVIIGGGGADTLFADKGLDTLIGGSGADVFRFKDDAQFNTITDFGDGSDTIHLANYREENGGVKLTFDQLLITQRGASTRIELDLDRNGVADVIDLDGDGTGDAWHIDLLDTDATTITAADFVL